FAYGSPLKNIEALPEQIDTFLSLEALDPGTVQIQTYVGNQSEKSLAPLITYVSAQKNQNFAPLISALKGVDQLTDQKEKAIQLVTILLPYKDLLRDESEQDSVIAFVHYGLKPPSNLSQQARAEIGNLVKQLDTAKQATKFDSGKCPKNYLFGNINVYPLALENSNWHSVVELNAPKESPILEIRFMGLKGIFRYLLDQMAARTGDSFVHLDGESI
ncbi:MAG: hypothetical protein ACRDF4_10715, partial [Rhabdochlamydiaceae bacterium]